jgi:hypothetical protein
MTMAACELCGCIGAGQCETCGNPLDAGVFDNSSIQPAPGRLGEEVVLARFALHRNHCGVLHYFAQFTDRFARDPAQVTTPGYQWQIRCDRQPLDPYLTFDYIINPWGLAAFPVDVRLGEGCTMEFTIRNMGPAPADVLQSVGGRILGRHWYDTRFGGTPRQL